MGHTDEDDSLHVWIGVKHQRLFDQAVIWNFGIKGIGVLTKTLVPEDSIGIDRLHPAD